MMCTPPPDIAPSCRRRQRNAGGLPGTARRTRTHRTRLSEIEGEATRAQGGRGAGFAARMRRRRALRRASTALTPRTWVAGEHSGLSSVERAHKIWAELRRTSGRHRVGTCLCMLFSFRMFLHNRTFGPLRGERGGGRGCGTALRRVYVLSECRWHGTSFRGVTQARPRELRDDGEQRAE